jgi:cytochrome c556
MHFLTKSAALAIVILGCASVSVVAADDPIKARQDLMGGIGKAMKVLVPMAQGKTAYDAAKATEALNAVATNIADFPNHFPAGSDQGKTDAMPAIWEKMDDFKAHATSLETDAKAALGATASLDTFKPAFMKMAGNCKSCHEAYRKPS